jgi:hypothetical protein
VIRIRGVPISDEEAQELASLLAGDEAGQSLSDRIGRALAMGSGVLAADRLGARCIVRAADDACHAGTFASAA